MSSTTTPHSPPVETLSELVCSCVESTACACLREAHYDGSHDDVIQTEVDGAHTAVLTHYTEPRRRARRKFMSLSKGRPRAERGNDPYDYEQKFPEDEPFKEMGPMARVWKTFLEEYAKFDSDRMEDWRDALDVLLVFAGLFSAVVTTFVVQTSQRLQIDYGEVAAHLMWEMIHLQRAMMDGAPSSSVTHSDISPTSPVRVSRTDSWVNALWFTSLALSLTTALMAVLTKQWIHQYMAVPSGTPCDRSRIRQYRFENIDKWHVPLIIGILPVLMHVALGIFFFGLVIYVRALSTPTAAVVSGIAFVAFVAYFGTTLLPVFSPDCPYKTYLTLYSYSISAYMCTTFRHSFDCARSWVTEHLHFNAQYELPKKCINEGLCTPDLPMSIKDVEKRTVKSMAEALEARALVGLYNISSNTSVQKIVLQALSAIPLEQLSVARTGIPDLGEAIRLLVLSMEYTAPSNQTAYERLYRAHVRVQPPAGRFVEPDVLTSSLSLAVRAPNSLSVLVDRRHPEHAIAYLRHQITLKERYQEFDVFMWARILQNALSTGAEWLDIGCNESPVWSNFVQWIIQSHGCSDMTSCKPCCVELVALPLFVETDSDKSKFGSLDVEKFRLRVRYSPEFPTPFPIELRYVVTILMRPSIVEYLLGVSFSDRCSGEEYQGLPQDILLNLALVQTPHVLQTSRQAGFTDEDDETEPEYDDDGVVPLVNHKTPVAKLLYCLREYVGVVKDVCWVPGATLGQHAGVKKATFHALHNIVTSEAFLDGTLAPGDKRKMIHILARIFVLDSDLDIFPLFCNSIPARLFHEISTVIFRDFSHLRGSLELAVELIDAQLEVPPSRIPAQSLGIEIFDKLADRDWLQEFQMRLVQSPGQDVDYRTWIYYSFLANSYVKGLEGLSTASPLVFKRTILEYLTASNNLFILCKMLLLSDDRRRQDISTLSSYFEHDCWAACLVDLRQFFNSEDGKLWYERYRRLDALTVQGYGGASEVLQYGPFEDVRILLSQLSSPKIRGASCTTASEHSGTTSQAPITIPEPLISNCGWRKVQCLKKVLKGLWSNGPNRKQMQNTASLTDSTIV